ncbi:unnamed protein product [Ectocarpus fasciculatus]
MAKETAKGSAAAVDVVRPSETPKDLKKRVRGLDKSLTSVHERLVQTEKQIFDLERSYLEETRLYGNVLQGWDAYLDTKGKGAAAGGKGEAAAGGRGGSNKREAVSEDGEEGEGANKRAKGVELEERLFSLGSVTSPAAKGLQKLEEARRRAGSGSGSAGGGGAAAASGGGVAPKTPKEKRSYAKRGSTKSSSKKDTSKKKRR